MTTLWSHSSEDHQVLIAGGPDTHPTNPRWQTAVNLKTVKSLYLRNRLTDFDEIWDANA